MYVLKNPIYELASSEFPIIYHQDQLAWLVVDVAWYVDPAKEFIVEEVAPPELNLDESADVIG
jgi:hypothetical protein